MANNEDYLDALLKEAQEHNDPNSAINKVRELSSAIDNEVKETFAPEEKEDSEASADNSEQTEADLLANLTVREDSDYSGASEADIDDLLKSIAGEDTSESEETSTFLDIENLVGDASEPISDSDTSADAIIEGAEATDTPDAEVADLLASLENLEEAPASEEGIEASVAMIQATGITWQGCISFIAFNMLTIPCFAACATAKGELNKGTFKYTLAFWVIASFLGAGFVYAFLSCFSLNTLAWAIPVSIAIVAIAVLTPFCIKWWNAYRAKKASKGA